MATITTLTDGYNYKLTSLCISAGFTVTPARAETSDKIYGDNPNHSTGVTATAGSLVQSAPCPQHSLSERHKSRFGVAASLRASFSTTFLQTLPELVTPLKGHSLPPHSCPPTRSAPRKVWVLIKLQALVYDILPSATAVFSYAIGPRKLSANEQFFVGAQTV